MSGLQTVSGWLTAADEADMPAPAGLETIRAAMLSHLLKTGAPEPRLFARLHVSTDTQALWYLRPMLMDALCRHLGEPRAAAALTEVTALFGGQYRVRRTAASATLRA